jgi:peptidoglycan/LPS O-acetylase OafA/YrhL
MIFYFTTIIRTVHNSQRMDFTFLTVLVPPFISIIFWFFSAPEPRFSGACFWLFGAGFSALAVEQMRLKTSITMRTLGCFLCVAFFVYMFPSYNSLFIPPNKVNGPLYDFHRPEYMTVSINNLANLNIPIRSDQCWDTPLPCTP